MSFAFSGHADQRMQQRSIPEPVVDLIAIFGTATRRRGADSVSLTREGWDELRELLTPGAFRRLESKLACYLIVDGEKVITVAHKRRH